MGGGCGVRVGVGYGWGAGGGGVGWGVCIHARVSTVPQHRCRAGRRPTALTLGFQEARNLAALVGRDLGQDPLGRFKVLAKNGGLVLEHRDGQVVADNAQVLSFQQPRTKQPRTIIIRAGIGQHCAARARTACARVADLVDEVETVVRRQIPEQVQVPAAFPRKLRWSGSAGPPSM